jgi:methyl-accepting chemotaxis protein
MDVLRQYSVRSRLWLILTVATVTLCAFGVLMLKDSYNHLYEGKAEKTQHVVETAFGVFKRFQVLGAADSLDRHSGSLGTIAQQGQRHSDAQTQQMNMLATAI